MNTDSELDHRPRNPMSIAVRLCAWAVAVSLRGYWDVDS